MKEAANLRSLAAQLIERVVDKGESLSAILPAAQKTVADKDGALLQELCFGVNNDGEDETSTFLQSLR